MDWDHRRLFANLVINLRVMQNIGTWIDSNFQLLERLSSVPLANGHNLLFSCVTCFTLKFKS